MKPHVSLRTSGGLRRRGGICPVGLVPWNAVAERKQARFHAEGAEMARRAAEKPGFWRFARRLVRLPREAPKPCLLRGPPRHLRALRVEPCLLANRSKPTPEPPLGPWGTLGRGKDRASTREGMRSPDQAWAFRRRPPPSRNPLQSEEADARQPLRIAHDPRPRLNTQAPNRSHSATARRPDTRAGSRRTPRSPPCRFSSLAPETCGVISTRGSRHSRAGGGCSNSPTYTSSTTPRRCPRRERIGQRRPRRRSRRAPR